MDVYNNIVTICLACILLTYSATADTGSCQPIVNSLKTYGYVYTYNNICYLFLNHEETWLDARHWCEKWGGDMVEIPDQGTQNFLIDKMDNQLRWKNNGVWIGLHNRGSGGWRWTTGVKQTYRFWDSGQPSKTFGFISFEDCACMRRKDGWKWHDYMCDNRLFTYRFICQYRMLTTTTTSTTTTTTTARTTTKVLTTTKSTEAYKTQTTSTETAVAPIFHAFLPKTVYNSQGIFPSDSSIGIQVASNIEKSQQDRGDGLSDTSKGAIIGLVLGGFVVLVIVGMIFILFRRRKKRKRDSDNLVVQFENTDYMRGYTQGYSPVSQSEGQVANGRPESHMYMDTNEMNRLYEQVTKQVDHGNNRYDQLKPKGALTGATACGGEDSCEDSDLKKQKVALPEDSKLNNDNEYIDMNASKPKMTNVEANARRLEKQNNLKDSEPLYSNETFQREGLPTPVDEELEILDYEESSPLDHGELHVEGCDEKMQDPIYHSVD